MRQPRLIKDATIEDLAYVGSWLCALDRKELSLTRDPDDYVRLANDAHDSDYCKVVLDGFEPVFAFGVKIDGSSAAVWSFKTEKGWAVVGHVTRYIRRTMIPLLRQRGVRHNLCLVHQDNEPSCRWLVHLGFRPGTEVPMGENTMILFQREDPAPSGGLS